MLFEFELDYNAAAAAVTKNICGANGKGKQAVH